MHSSAHPIYLCLALIMYAVHRSSRCCRWIWWGI